MKMLADVPARNWMTLTLAGSMPVWPRQFTVEADVQAVVRQSLMSPIRAVGVRAYPPKLSPLIVTLVPPDVGVFCLMADETDGASKLRPPRSVPTVALTVITEALL